MPFRIMIGADLVPTESNAEFFKRGDARTLVGEELLEIVRIIPFLISKYRLRMSSIRS